MIESLRKGDLARCLSAAPLMNQLRSSIIALYIRPVSAVPDHAYIFLRTYELVKYIQFVICE